MGHARVALPSVLTFTVLTLVVTLIHLDVFHLGPGHPVTARLAAWGWLAVYVGFPVAAALALVGQVRLSGVDPPRRFRLNRWFRALLTAQGALMLVVGAAMLVLPSLAGPWWPWPLTTLTSQAIGAWGVGLGVALVHGLVEDDWLRLRSGLGLYLGFGGLGLIAMVRYADAVSWGRASAWILVALLASLLGAGIYAALRLRQVDE